MPPAIWVSTLLIAGGVAANSRLRDLAEQRCAAAGLTLRIPRPRLCTDNGCDDRLLCPRTWWRPMRRRHH